MSGINPGIASWTGDAMFIKESSMRKRLGRFVDMLLDTLERVLKHIEAWVLLGFSG